ncbi:MAG TPA: 16S rRNA (cytosine(967)-C(5))-methyltransferase RsmB [Actinomycetota bacterium]|nr:16S rRNA (cytosine(967)-C(5))-methyltransferase RsmB [Actinomycetota bacterium]
MSGPTSARAVALDVVRRVTDEGAYSNLALRRALDRAHLPDREAAFATELAYGTLRRLVPIDHVLEPLLERPLALAPKAPRAALRLGAYQFRYTRVPPHAAVSETVSLVDRRHRGFVNAVLRRLTSEPSAETSGRSDEAVSVRTGLSAWAVRELRRILPDDDEVEAAAAALGERGPVTIRVNTCRASIEEVERELAGAGVGTERGEVHRDSLQLSAGDPGSLPGFRQGRFAVQDQASAFVVAALDVRQGQRVLDVCAAPGGKTGHLACLAGEAGEVVAADVSPTRLSLARAGLVRLGVPARLLVQDGRRPAVASGFDRILVDAPCSGIGSARRRPELLWRAHRDELSGLARLQVGIGTAAAGLLAPGGRLVYSVCTFPRAETDAACDALLRRAPELQPAPVDGPDGAADRVRLWPHRHGCDAMFVAAFRRGGQARD